MITASSEIRELLNHSEGYTEIIIDIPNLADGRSWGKLLTRYHNECGCGAGGVLSMGTVGLYVTSVMIDFPISTEMHWPTLLALFVFSAAAGKIGGLVWGRLKLRQTIERLEKALSHSQPNVSA